MLDVEWSDTARADLLAIVDYISDDDVDAALSLKEDIESKSAALSSHPNMYRKGRVIDTREMVVRENYIVIYSVRSHTIHVLRVLHAKRMWPI